MKIVKQPIEIEIKNLDVIPADAASVRPRHSSLLPDTLRGLIIGPSGSGKTSVLLSLLFDANGLKFENVYVYSKSLFQPKYQLLEKVLKEVKGVSYFPYSANDDVIDPKDAKENSVFIFDDVACEKQNKMQEYFSFGRHMKIDTFYLCQTYVKIPKHLCRDNASLLVLFKMDTVNLKHIFLEHVVPDMAIEKFLEICRVCWRTPFSVLVIVKDCELNNGRYRRGFYEFINI